jgi:lipoate-protein ligase A
MMYNNEAALGLYTTRVSIKKLWKKQLALTRRMSGKSSLFLDRTVAYGRSIALDADDFMTTMNVEYSCSYQQLRAVSIAAIARVVLHSFVLFRPET